ncbi:hypothetical protein PV325_001782, partial [Microctonus aethiopoides]
MPDLSLIAVYDSRFAPPFYRPMEKPSTGKYICIISSSNQNSGDETPRLLLCDNAEAGVMVFFLFRKSSTNLILPLKFNELFVISISERVTGGVEEAKIAA